MQGPTLRAAIAASIALLTGGCRDKTSSSEGVPPSSTASSSASASVVVGAPVEARGWFIVVDGNATAAGPRRSGTGWWFAGDAVRIVWPEGRDRRAVTESRKDGDLLHLVVEEGATYDVTRTSTGLLVKISNEETPVRLRVATNEELRAMEKLDAKLMAKSGVACAQATTCCEAARKKNLAVAEDCIAVAAAPELSRCVRTLERLRKAALSANQPLPECAEAP
jgi:hypothetical protein